MWDRGARAGSAKSFAPGLEIPSSFLPSLSLLFLSFLFLLFLLSSLSSSFLATGFGSQVEAYPRPDWPCPRMPAAQARRARLRRLGWELNASRRDSPPKRHARNRNRPPAKSEPIPPPIPCTTPHASYCCSSREGSLLLQVQEGLGPLNQFWRAQSISATQVDTHASAQVARH